MTTTHKLNGHIIIEVPEGTDPFKVRVLVQPIPGQKKDQYYIPSGDGFMVEVGENKKPEALPYLPPDTYNPQM